MMRALFSGVTGLQSHQTRMDVIGNNIANVNTMGFKKSTTTFSDLYSQTISPASAPTGNIGGTNAKQVGLGASVASITMNHNPGAAQYTGGSLDVAIEGDGYFCVKTPDGIRYTRAGNFNVSSTGSLVDCNGYFVQCYGAAYKVGNNAYAKSTGFTGEKSTSFENFEHVTQNPDGTPSLDPTAQSGVYTFQVIKDVAQGGQLGSVKIFRNGLDTGKVAAVTGPNNGIYTINLNDPNLDLGLGTITFAAQAGAANPPTPGTQDIADELADVVDFMQIEVTNNDGFTSNGIVGDMVIDQNLYYNVTINDQGAVVGQLREDLDAEAGSDRPAMAKGEKVVLGYITLATFTNNPGLEKLGNNLYAASSNSGTPSYNIPGEAGVGALAPSSLEMSNVDLSEEMVNMIVTQRGFQANSRIITTTDTMLEELVNLKR